MATRIHPKNVHEKSPKNVHEMSSKKRTSRGQKCPRNVTKSVHDMSPLLSMRCHLLCPQDVCHLAVWSIWAEQPVLYTLIYFYPAQPGRKEAIKCNVWCIKNQTNHSSKTVMSLVRFLLYQTLHIWLTLFAKSFFSS